MRRNRPPPAASSPYRALAHHQAYYGTGMQQAPESVSSLLRSFNVEANPARPVRPSPLAASTISDMPLDLVDRIRSFPLFSSAPEDFLVTIGTHLRPQVHAANDHILTEGDEAKSMYWLVRGVVAVISRDGEAVYAELKPGAFFGEIGVLMEIPRTATIIARTKCLVMVLKKEDLQAELPKFPDMEKAIRQEAQERLTILQKKRQERGQLGKHSDDDGPATVGETAPGEPSTVNAGIVTVGPVLNSKKRKSPSPGVVEDLCVSGSALASGIVNVRKTLKELPLFSNLPSDLLHMLGLSAQPRSYSPFTDIVRQGMPGNDIYFIVRGEAEVIHEELKSRGSTQTARSSYTRPRLKQGQYFGEVASLGLSKGRTATVRSITSVECLVIGGEALEDLWKRCPPEIRAQVEETARSRYRKPTDSDDDDDAEMADAGSQAVPHEEAETPAKQARLPEVTFTTPSKPPSPSEESDMGTQPSDPDPYLSVDMENIRNRRRNSSTPPAVQAESTLALGTSGAKLHNFNGVPLKTGSTSSLSAEDDSPNPSKRARTLARRPHRMANERDVAMLPDDILVSIFTHLDLVEMIRLKAVSTQWRQLLCESPLLCTHIDMSSINRKVTDWSVTHILSCFIGQRPVEMDISNCFHLTDEGFQVLWQRCGKNVRVWRMRSVWDVSAGQILGMSENATGLEEVDWSNCRKVGDNLLARVVGWVVPGLPAPRENANNVVIAPSQAKGKKGSAKASQQQQQKAEARNEGSPQNQHRNPLYVLPPGTIIGCHTLSRLNLSYCKHVTDRSMAHLAMHASSRLQSLTLTRCTSITDAGFQSWAPHRFSVLTHLSLADCTYLSDNSIISIVDAAKNLTHLDLSFCCALSDTATEVVALGLPRLHELRMAFCGSAVSDASLGCIALHLSELRGLSVRGCVRVTGIGVENVLEGCDRLIWLDVSQCKNLSTWLQCGGIMRWGFDERGIGHELWRQEDAKRQTSLPQLEPSQVQVDNKLGAGVAGVGSAAGAPQTWHASGMKTVSPGPMMRAVITPRGVNKMRNRRPVKFIVEKGGGGLR